MKIGVVGIGRWGTKVLGEYMQLVKEGQLEGVGICDLRKDVLKKYPDDILKSESYSEFIESKEIDAVHICVGNDLHFQVASNFLRAGKHVLVEKPMATSSSSAYDLIEIAEGSGLTLQVGHIYRFANVIQKLKKLVSERYFGQIRYVKVRWTHLMNPIPGTDVVWDLLPHPIDILNIITGEWPLHVTLAGFQYRTGSLCETAFVSMTYKHFFANVELSWLDPTRRRIIEIVGSERGAYVECDSQMLSVIKNDSRKWEQIPIKRNNTIRDEARNFLFSIKNYRSFHNSHIVGARTISAIESIDNLL